MKMLLHSIILLAVSIPVVKTQCSGTFARREIRSLSTNERNTLLDAFKQLNTGTKPTAWDKMTNLHDTFKDQIHGWPLFLPVTDKVLQFSGIVGSFIILNSSYSKLILP